MIHSQTSLWIFFMGAACTLCVLFGVLAVLLKTKALICSSGFVLCNVFWTWSTLNIDLADSKNENLANSLINYLYWSSPSIAMIVAGLALVWWLESPRKDRYITNLLKVNLTISLLGLIGMNFLHAETRAYIVFFIQPLLQLSLIWLVSIRSSYMNNSKSKILAYVMPLGYFSVWYASDFILNPKQLNQMHLIYSPLMNLFAIMALAFSVLKISIASAGNSIRFKGYEKKWDHLTLLPISLEFVRLLEGRFLNSKRDNQPTIICSVSVDESNMRHGMGLGSLDIDDIYVTIANRIQNFNKFSDVVGRYTSSIFVAVFSINEVPTFLDMFSKCMKEPFEINNRLGASQTLNIPIDIRFISMKGRRFALQDVLYELQYAPCV